MVVFLTSSFIKYQPIKEYVPHPLDESNGFGDNLRKYWVEDANFLIFANDPGDEELGEHACREMGDAFSLSGFSMGGIKYFDNKYIEEFCQRRGFDRETAGKEALREALEWADVLYLAGGHGPTQNAFMKECELKSLLNDNELFDGIVIGLSAGSVNAAEEAYLLPELPGESVDPEYVRFTDGLGLTSINMVPHKEFIEAIVLDGKKLIDEIIAGDSYGRKLYLVSDGSYFMIRNGITEFFGEGAILKDGVTRPISSGIINADNRKFCRRYVDIFDTNVSSYYDGVFVLDIESSRVEFLHISEFFLENGIVPINIDSFEEFNQLFSEKLVVQEEKEPYVDQTQMGAVLDELKSKGCFVRTVHLDTVAGIKAESIRIKRIGSYERKYLVSLMDITMILDRDWMTDEYSRSGFLAKAEKLLKESEYQEGYSLVYANIQGFKAANDLLGTQSGDMMIFMECDALEKELNPVMIARLESDHFAVLTKTENITEETLERLCHQCYEEGTKRLSVLIRCGIYNITDFSKTVSHMLDQAKLAEKSITSQNGVPYAICSEQMTQEYMSQRIFVSELDSALEKGEFLPYYQPIVDAKTGEIVSAEVLIRWKHSERGMIPPIQFIPTFEKEGVITKVDSFMVNSVLDFNMKRLEKGQRVVPCAVNLSRVDFYDTKFMNALKHKLETQENIQKMIKMEMTESAYTILESDALAFFEEMKRLHLSFQLDDFGSGMSSLSTLELYDFDTVKLDMGFIRKIGKSAKAEAIIRHTIGMVHDMGAKIIAEGVETKEQLEFLQAVECDMIQGYYFYKPMPQEEFASLL